jgi:hypothetical protein
MTVTNVQDHYSLFHKVTFLLLTFKLLTQKVTLHLSKHGKMVTFVDRNGVVLLYE